MARSVSFIHAADLHLGAPLRGLKNLSPYWARRISRAILEAYDKLIDAACTRRVDFVIFAGDVFDTTRPSFLEFKHFIQGLKRLDNEGIPAYLCTGNHDPYTSWSTDFEHLPSNVHIFSPHEASYAEYRKDGESLVAFGGRSYYNQTFPHDQSIIKGLQRSEILSQTQSESPFVVGVVHTGLHFDAIKAPAKLSELYACNLDYWALGHIHKRWQDSKEDPHVAYSGVVQGRDIKEAGPRGVNLVRLCEDEPNQIEFIPCSSVVWQLFDYDVSTHDTLASIQEGILRALFALNGNAYCEEMCTRITLTGATNLTHHLRNPQTLEDLRCALNNEYSNFYCDALVNKTHVPFVQQGADVHNPASSETGFLGLVSKQSQEKLASPQEILNRMQEDFIQERITSTNVSLEVIPHLQEEAYTLVRDLLTQRGKS